MSAMLLSSRVPVSAPFLPACPPGKSPRKVHRFNATTVATMKDRPDGAGVELTRRSAVTASFLAIGLVLTSTANAAKEGKKKKNATKGGLFNPAQRSQDLALAEEQRKVQLKEKYAKLRAEGGAPAAE